MSRILDKIYVGSQTDSDPDANPTEKLDTDQEKIIPDPQHRFYGNSL
jgi:hypothetical protein